MRVTWAIVLAAVLLAIVPSQVASQTRGDTGNFNPAATLDITQVVTVPAEEQYADEEIQSEYFDIEGPDGVIHEGCTIEVDEPSSHMICADGYTEES